MYSVSQVAQPDFAHSWHEAVALVQEVASQLDPDASVPAPDDLLLDEDGTLIFGFANEAPDPPVTSLGRLLKTLLDGTSAPPGLRDLAHENASDDPAHTTVPGFCRALSFYERPNRANDLLAVAGRLKAARIRRDADYEVERLREKFGPPPDPEPVETLETIAAPVSAEEVQLQDLRAALRKPQGPWKLNWRVSKRHGRVAVAGGVLAAVILFVAGFAVSGGRLVGLNRTNPFAEGEAVAPPQPASSDAAVGTSAPAAPLSPELLEPPNIAEATAAADRRPEAKPHVPDGGTRSTARAVDGAAATSTPSAPVRPSTTRRTSPPVTESAIPGPSDLQRAAGMSDAAGAERFVDLSPNPPPARTPEPARGGGGIYTSADTDVSPPTLIRPQLPSQPSPGATTGYFEMLVDERGAVQQVRLVSPTGHYHDRMLVPAAKAWKFRPATLNGRAVKYRMLLPITIPDKK
jgi:hypothetical protein